ncbi:hypothetical protein LSAT2_018068 [Lamellibrachia satsuma]|nr:hypothetical protein LSAT2_018068 [Lamellibrachia satsuma]
MNSIALAFLLLLVTVTVWADTTGEIDGIQYNIECVEACKEVHLQCHKSCEGATNDDCKNMSAESSADAVRVFAIVQRLYTFLSASPQRWSKLLENLPKQSPVSERFDRFENEAKSVAPGLDYDDENKRAKKRKLFHDETPDEVKVSDCRENFRVNTYLVIIDRLLSEIKKRKAAYTNVYVRFGEIRSLADSDITSKCEELTRYYDNDTEPDFEKEFRLFTKYGDFETGEDLVLHKQTKSGADKFAYILRGVTLNGAASGESPSTVHPPESHSISTVHPPRSHSRHYILRGVTLNGAASGESLSMVHLPESHSQQYILRGVTLDSTFSWESLSKVQPPMSHFRQCVLWRVTLDSTSSGVEKIHI